MAFTDESCRAAFPSLKNNQIFFDNTGGSQTLGAVIDSICDYYTHSNVQLDATYAMSQQATSRFDGAHDICASYINAQPDEVVLGSATTQLFRNLSYALKLNQGDEIIVSSVDHEANIAPWVDLAEQKGLKLKWWKPNHLTSPKLLASDLEAIISEETKLVCCTHASNILGTITDIKSIARVAHRWGAMICVDGVGYAPHRPIDVKDLGVDFYCFSWYKVYGPHISMLYGSRAAQHHVRPLGHFFNSHIGLSDKLGLAGANYEMTQSLPHIVKYLGPGGGPMWNAIIEREEVLQSTLIDYLRSRPEITIYGEPHGDAKIRLSTISFTVKGWNSQDFCEAIEAKTSYGVRSGTNYADRLVREVLGLGRDGVVRVGMLHYNTRKCEFFCFDESPS